MTARVFLLAILINSTIPCAVFSQATAYANIYANVIAPIGVAKAAGLSIVEAFAARISDSTDTLEFRKLVSRNLAYMNGSMLSNVTSISLFVGNNTAFSVTLPFSLEVPLPDKNGFVATDLNPKNPEAVNLAECGNRLIQVGDVLHIYRFSGDIVQKKPAPFWVTINYN